MGKNRYVQTLETRRLTYMQAEKETYTQYMIDMFCDVLNDPDVMGKDVMGHKRLKKILLEVSKRYDYYHPALEKSSEADYYQDKLDAKMKRIFQEDFCPFPKRYEWVNRPKY